ncbi:MAG: metal ABC transporter solute-binding protein, Zn/Mn family [Candidatus Aminicenantales bacterium]
MTFIRAVPKIIWLLMYCHRRPPLAFGLVLLALSAAVFASPDSPSPQKIMVVATVLPLAEFAREIAGDRGEIVMLLPPGADVHTWQPRISDIRKLETADILVSIGQGLEPWLESMLKGTSAGRVTRLEAADGLDLIAAEKDKHEAGETSSHHHDGVDPHVWLDFHQDEMIVDALAGALSRIASDAAEDFTRKAEALKGRLRALDAAYRSGLEKYKGRAFLVAGHAAFGYLARRYGLRQVAVYGLSPDAAPTTRETADVISRAKAEGVKTVFGEPVAGLKMARVIAAEIGADVRILYPGHNLTPEQAAEGMSFFRLMEENLENLIHGFADRR